MPHIFSDSKILNFYSLEHKPLVGDGDCVELVRRYAPTLKDRSTLTWHQGQRVVDIGPGRTLIPGTVIATFYKGRYPSWPHGNHAAFFVRVTERDKDGKVTEIMVMDQWRGSSNRQFIASRRLWIKKSPEKLGSGQPNMSNDLSYFYVVE